VLEYAVRAQADLKISIVPKLQLDRAVLVAGDDQANSERNPFG